VVVALSVWWKKLAADGCNANEVTSQALSDIGRGATFYDCLVDVQRTTHGESRIGPKSGTASAPG